MGLGGVSASIVTGGAKSSASGSDLAKNILGIGVCTDATVATLLHPSSSTGSKTALGSGPLADAQALLWTIPGAPAPYALPVSPSVAGGVGTVVHTGPGSGTVTPTCAPHIPILVKITTAGTIGTAAFKISYDGGTTFGAAVTTSGTTFTYAVPKTFTSLLFDAGTYVLNSTYAIGIDGTITRAGSAIDKVTQTSSPIDAYDMLVTCYTAGALGTCAIAVSIDGGKTLLGSPFLVPSGGVVVVPGTGVVLTCASTFVKGDTYAFPCAPPAPSSSDITTAITAALADPTSPAACVIDLGTLPGSAASAFSLADTLETALETAFTSSGKDWLVVMTCPLVGDNIVLTGTTQIDTADTRAVVKAARAGKNDPRVSVFAGTDNVAIGLGQVRRPRSTIFAARVAAKLPVEADGSTVATRDTALKVSDIGDDERFAGTSLYDAQVNTFQTIQGDDGAFLTVGRGYYGWQNLTTDAQEVDADSFRAINAILAGFRPAAARLVGRRFAISADGTINDKVRETLNSQLDAAIKKRAGIGQGADFGGIPQASDATAYVNPATNLGSSGDKVIKVIASVLPEGFASAVDIELHFLGA